MIDDPSPARVLVRKLVADLGRAAAHIAIETMLARFSVSDCIALVHYWPLWARPKQLPPPMPWRSWGFLTARRFGKTRAISEWLNGDIEMGKAQSIAVAAQDEDNAINIQINGIAGLVSTAPPWFKPVWASGEKILHYPNGAKVYVRTPERPGKIRGLEFDRCWLTELQSWPPAKRDEAFSNLRLATSMGDALLAWDATPKRGHPILKALLSDNERDPQKHVIVRGSIYENADVLGPGFVEDEEQRIGGTRRGREELLGEMLSDAEGAVVNPEWIVHAGQPDQIRRRVLGIDPAVTSRAGNDLTGIVDAALGLDMLAYILGDYTGRHSPSEWAKIVIDKYFAGRCDCVVLERNKAGDLVVENLRAAAKARGIAVHVLPEKEKEKSPPKHEAGKINVREVYARGPKEDRAQPLSIAYEQRRIVHVLGVDLEALEETITTWEPQVGQRSPDRLDAEVHAVGEVLDLKAARRDPKEAMKGLDALTRGLAGARSSSAFARDLQRRMRSRPESV